MHPTDKKYYDNVFYKIIIKKNVRKENHHILGYQEYIIILVILKIYIIINFKIYKIN